MLKQRQFVGLIALFVILSLAACQVAPSSQVEDARSPKLAVTVQQISYSINLTALAGLDQTTRIDVLRREDRGDSTAVHFEQLFVITDDATIHTLVEALDGNLTLIRHAQCPARYTLVFHFRDGRQREFDYACQMASPSYLRGGQMYWQGKDVIAPDAFNRVIGKKLNESRGSEASLLE